MEYLFCSPQNVQHFQGEFFDTEGDSFMSSGDEEDILYNGSYLVKATAPKSARLKNARLWADMPPCKRRCVKPLPSPGPWAARSFAQEAGKRLLEEAKQRARRHRRLAPFMEQLSAARVTLLTLEAQAIESDRANALSLARQVEALNCNDGVDRSASQELLEVEGQGSLSEDAEEADADIGSGSVAPATEIAPETLVEAADQTCIDDGGELVVLTTEVAPEMQVEAEGEGDEGSSCAEDLEATEADGFEEADDASSPAAGEQEVDVGLQSFAASDESPRRSKKSGQRQRKGCSRLEAGVQKSRKAKKAAWKKGKAAARSALPRRARSPAPSPELAGEEVDEDVEGAALRRAPSPPAPPGSAEEDDETREEVARPANNCIRPSEDEEIDDAELFDEVPDGIPWARVALMPSGKYYIMSEDSLRAAEQLNQPPPSAEASENDLDDMWVRTMAYMYDRGELQREDDAVMDTTNESRENHPTPSSQQQPLEETPSASADAPMDVPPQPVLPQPVLSQPVLPQPATPQPSAPGSTQSLQPDSAVTRKLDEVADKFFALDVSTAHGQEETTQTENAQTEIAQTENAQTETAQTETAHHNDAEMNPVENGSAPAGAAEEEEEEEL